MSKSTLRERITARDPDVIDVFLEAERGGYRVGWHHSQNLTLYYGKRPVGGWNSVSRHWYIAVRWLTEANLPRVELAGFKLDSKSSSRPRCILPGAEHADDFRVAVGDATGVDF